MPPPCLTIIIPGRPARAGSTSPSTSRAAFGIPTYSHRLTPAPRHPRPLILNNSPSSFPGMTTKSPVRSAPDARSPEWWVGEASADEVARARVAGPRPMPVGGPAGVRGTAGMWESSSPAHSSYHSPSTAGSTPVSPVEELSEPVLTVPAAGPARDATPSPPYTRRPSTYHPRNPRTNPFTRGDPIIARSATTLPLYNSTEDLFARAPPHWLDPSHVAAATGPVEPSLGRPETAAQKLRRAWVCPWEGQSPNSARAGQEKDTCVEMGGGEKAGAREGEKQGQVALASAVADRRGMLVALAVGLVVLLLLADLIWVNVELVKVKRAGW